MDTAYFPLAAGSSLAAALFLPTGFLVTLLFYFLLTTLYSFRLKKIALLDVIVLASLFTTRIIAGSTATGIVVSEWLLAFSMFVFFSLAAVKRYAELLRMRSKTADGESKLRRRGYFSGDHELILQMGISSGFMTVHRLVFGDPRRAEPGATRLRSRRALRARRRCARPALAFAIRVRIWRGVGSL